jgi:2-dehydro-3-deoxyphosphogluconate aldolase/(4S)-4-hydroxy-2-oxoglutarate aldolase
MSDLFSRLAAARVIPVVSLAAVDHAVPIARALLAGGIDAIEIVLRTESAYDGIRAVKAEVPEIALGVGSVFNTNQVKFCKEVGVDFVVTPGTTDTLYKATADAGLTLIPGVATLSEALRALEHGHDKMKFFPAEALGGVKTLKAMSGPMPQLKFMPTGGVNPDNLGDYMALPNVMCCGGSWVTKGTDWDVITQRAKAAVSA